MNQINILQRPQPDGALPVFKQTNPVLARIYASRGIHDLNGLYLSRHLELRNILLPVFSDLLPGQLSPVYDAER